MKIIIVGTAYPYRGGLAAFNERLAVELTKTGHEVIIYTFTLQYPSFLFPGKTQYSSEPSSVNIKTIRCINSINPLNWYRVGRMIKNEKADLCIFVYWMTFMAPCLGSIARFSSNVGLKRIGLIHNMIPHESSILDKFLPKYFVSQMQGFLSLSHAVSNDINKFDSENKPKLVTPHPLYDQYGEKMSRQQALHHLNLDVHSRYVLFFGFIRSYKGLDILLKAFADEELRKLKVKLIVAGEFYENENLYFDLVKKLELQDKILWYNNFIIESDVKYFFNASDIVVQPYKTATQSGVTQIAYHFEKPMMVTNVGGLSEIMANGKVGYLVEPDPNDISEKLKDFFINERYTDFDEAIKYEKKKFEWKILLDKINALMNVI